ncbi:Mycocerosic acid synthase [Fusarium oxysporum f. sp. matthiolae]|nr:Mycocerosic acid synthase [Fusarium oxysporum f. sp. matthiolae]
MAKHTEQEPIAIVGIGCRFPGGINTKADLWQVLCQGLDVLTEVPADRFDVTALHDDDVRKYGVIRSCRGGFLDDIYGFDAEFFGLYPGETSRMDPQQRLALEASVHAIEDSGTPLHRVAGSRTGVFLGTFMSDHLSMQTAMEQRDNISPHSAMGVSNSSIANRVSHRLDLQGASVTLDTACSSSLVALHLACQSLWTGESEGALTGGVNALLRPESTILMTKAGFLSPDGACKSFDAAGNGYVRSEGAGMVYLKPLSRALQDNDRIYATIRGSLVNSDGYTSDGFTVPSLKAQTALLQRVYSNAGVDPSMVRYVEAHGPGTPVGDPVEARAVGGHIGLARGKGDEFLWISSIKGNLGHLEGASGIAGLIKAALVAYHGAIPPQVNHSIPNPAIDLQSLRLKIPRCMIDLKQDVEGGIMVGVNSFGAGGTNAHVILEQAPPIAGGQTSLHDPRVFLLSARSLSALKELSDQLIDHLKHQQPNLTDIAYTLASRRSRHRHICIIPARQLDELCDRLSHLSSGRTPKEALALEKKYDRPRVAFAFSGQGGQWFGMGLALAQQELVFRESLTAFDEIFRTHSGISIVHEISKHQDESRLNSTTIVQPAIVAIQIALARTLISYGLEPEAIVGHSIGEVAAAHLAGALSLEQAVTVIYYRSKIQNRAADLGSMLAVGLSSTEAEKIISRKQVAKRVAVAAMNGPKMTTIAGDSADLQLIAKELELQGTFARFVNVEVPYHSHFMDPLETDLTDALASIQGIPTNISLYSTVTASIEPGTHLTGKYWFDNVRKPVRYVETAKRLIDDGYNFVVEIGPHPVLVSGTRDIAEAAGRKVHILPAMMRGKDLEPFAIVLGAGYAVGADVQIDVFNGGGGHFIDLPMYPFQRKHFSFEHPEAQQRRLGISRHPFNGGLTSLSDDGRGSVRLRASTGVSPFLAEHVADGTMIFPASAHIEAAYMAAKEFMPLADVWLEDLKFEHPLVLAPPEEFAPQVLLEITSIAKTYTISSRPADSPPSTPWQTCSTGRINALDSMPNTSAEALENVRSRVQAGKAFDKEEFYSTLERSGLRYGETFQGIQELWQLGTEIFAHVKLPEPLTHDTARFRFHPASLDACLHTLFADVQHRGDARYVYLPHKIERVQVSDTYGATEIFVYTKIQHHDSNSLRCDTHVYNASGRVLATIIGMTVKRLLGAHIPEPVEYETTFQEESRSTGNRTEADFASVLVLGSRNLEVTQLAREAFPRASVSHKPVTWIERFADSTAKDFRLDRRTLIVISTLTPSPDHDLVAQMGSVVPTLLHLSHWIHHQGGTPTVAVLLAGACMTPSDSQCNPATAALEAAVRLMVNELPQSDIRVIDLPLGQNDWDFQSVKEELLSNRHDRHDTVVAIRPGGRFVRRIIPLTVEEAEKRAMKKLPAQGGRYTCEPDQSGIIVRQQTSKNLGAEEVAIEVHAASLNFKDVMNERNLTSDLSVSGALSGQKLGLEVAGKVVDIGANVNDIQLGTKVMARVANGLGGFVTTDRCHVSPIPKQLTASQAASIPVAYVTAYYALVHLGRLTDKDTVLIHAAAGGVGGAAIQIAKLCGARILATAGNPKRRAWVLGQGVAAVFDSRSVSFYDDIKAFTNDRGVDVVLNCLTGSLFSQSFACLAPFGRFLEIGTTDINRNTKLGVGQFSENRSFLAVDVDRMALQKPELHARVLKDVYTLFESGKLVPPPITEYPITQLSRALKSLSRSAVIGKVVMTMPENTTIEASVPTRLNLRADRSYLITGGASGLGLQIARFLAERGAKHLILVSRSGPKTAEDKAILLEMEASGVVITIEHADISNREMVASLFCKRDWPTIAGIVHCANVLRELYSYDTSMEDFWTVFNPKALGAWNLHLETKDMHLDFFVMTSSISSMLGLIGQFSYAASNQFLDSLAHYRQANGLPGLSLNYGVLGDFASMTRKSVETDKLMGILRSYGLYAMSLPMVLSAFERSILQGATQRMPLNINWSVFLRAHPHLLRDGAFFGLDAEESRNGDPASCGSFSSPPGPAPSEAIAETLRSRLAKILGVEVNQIALTEKIDQYAFDSITMTQIRGVILQEFRISFALMRLFQGPSLQEIANEVSVQMGNETNNLTNSENGSGSDDDHGMYDGLSVVSKWFVRGVPPVKTRGRLFLFHPMGTGASFFAPFLLDPPEGFDTVAVQLPGREGRNDEPVPSQMAEIVTGIVSEIGEIGAQDVFWGHSFGGVVAFETLRALKRRRSILPRLVVTGTIAPHLVRLWQKRDVLLRVMADDYSPDYMLAVSRYVDDANFFRALLPKMKKDMPFLMGYQYVEEDETLGVPITAFAARQDDVVYADEIQPWASHTGDFRLFEVDGDHWFVHRNRDLLRQTLERMAI